MPDSPIGISATKLAAARLAMQHDYCSGDRRIDEALRSRDVVDQVFASFSIQGEWVGPTAVTRMIVGLGGQAFGLSEEESMLRFDALLDWILA